MSKENDMNENKKDTAVSEQKVVAPEKRTDNEELTKAVKALIARSDRQYKLNKKICVLLFNFFVIFYGSAMLVKF